MLRLPIVLAVPVLGLMLAAQVAYAGPSPRDDESMDLIIKTRLLLLPQVQKELNLSDEQKEKIDEECSGPMATGPGFHEYEVNRVKSILKPEQLQRLKEISLQSSGALALRLLANELGISEQQLQELSERYDKRMLEHAAKYRDVPLEKREQKMAESRAEMPKVEQKMMQDALEVLTPKQRQKFEKMLGKKVDFDLSLGPRPGQIFNPTAGSKKAAWTQLDLLIANHGLLLRPQVQKELGLSDEQKQKISEDSAEPGPGYLQEEAKRLRAILKPEQMERARQFLVQKFGPLALRQFNVVRALGITEQQLRKIGEIENKQLYERGKMLSRTPIEERQEKLAEWEAEQPKLQRKMMQDMLKVLTPEQRKQFKEMRGKEIDPDLLRSP
jgi:Spy/CpxP family protein refolding chaperone